LLIVEQNPLAQLTSDSRRCPTSIRRDIHVRCSGAFEGRSAAPAATPKIATNQTAVVSNVRLCATISLTLFQGMVFSLAIVSTPLWSKLA
jgi:hypothetical protein